MTILIVIAASLGGILLFLLASASANTALFASHYPWLLGLNAVVALALLALIGWHPHPNHKIKPVSPEVEITQPVAAPTAP